MYQIFREIRNLVKNHENQVILGVSCYFWLLVIPILKRWGKSIETPIPGAISAIFLNAVNLNGVVWFYLL